MSGVGDVPVAPAGSVTEVPAALAGPPGDPCPKGGAHGWYREDTDRVYCWKCGEQRDVDPAEIELRA